MAPRLRDSMASLPDEPIDRFRTTVRPDWLKQTSSSFRLPEKLGGFRPTDLVLPIEAPPEDPRPADCRKSKQTSAKEEGAITYDKAMQDRLLNPERFPRHLRRLHEHVGRRKVITAFEMCDGTSRQQGQVFIENLYGWYEVEDWYDEEARDAQLAWTRWVLGMLQADREDIKIPQCPLKARDILRWAVENVLLDRKPKKWYKRMLETTRLEAGILQVTGLKRLARSPCTFKMDIRGDEVTFSGEAKNIEVLPLTSSDDMLDRMASFCIIGRIGQVFDDAAVAATGMRSTTPWAPLQRKFAQLDQDQQHPRIQSSIPSHPYAPVRPSGLRTSTLPPRSEDSTLGPETKKARKATPYWTQARLRFWYQVDLAEATSRLPDGSVANILDEVKKIRIERAAPPKPFKDISRATSAAPQQQQQLVLVKDTERQQGSSSVQAGLDDLLINDVQKGTKRPLSEVNTTPGSSEHAIKRARIEKERRRSSPILTFSPAQDAIKDAMAENKKRRSNLLSSSPLSKQLQRRSMQTKPPVTAEKLNAESVEDPVPAIPTPRLVPRQRDSKELDSSAVHVTGVQAGRVQQSRQVPRKEVVPQLPAQIQDQSQQQSVPLEGTRPPLQAPERNFQVARPGSQLTQLSPELRSSRAGAHQAASKLPEPRVPTYTQTPDEAQRRTAQTVPSNSQALAQIAENGTALLEQLEQAEHGTTAALSQTGMLSQTYQQLPQYHAQQQPYQQVPYYHQQQHPPPPPAPFMLQHPAAVPYQGQQPLPNPTLPSRDQPATRADFRRAISMVQDPIARIHAGSVEHGRQVQAQLRIQRQLIQQSLRSQLHFDSLTPQQQAAEVEGELFNQLVTAEQNMERAFPELVLFDHQQVPQPMPRLIHYMSQALVIVNPPPVGSAPQYREWHRACCGLESRVVIIELLRQWTQDWARTADAAREAFRN